MINRLEEQANTLGHVALGEIWRLKLLHEVNHLKEEGREEIQQYQQILLKRKLLKKTKSTAVKRKGGKRRKVNAIKPRQQRTVRRKL
jgi:hypothetical protein